MKRGALYAGLALTILILFLRFFPTKSHSADIPGYTPIKDDALALKYRPVIYSGNFTAPEKLYYRAARDAEGSIHMTYHFVWPYERNDTSSFGAFMSRSIYTGGLRIQRIMFGKGDIEMVSLKISRDGKISTVTYETAENYDPRTFGVKHKTIEMSVERSVPGFRVMSWNHLFEPVGGTSMETGTRSDLTPEYFTNALWEEYEMFKAKETFLKKSRAHLPYERAGAE